MAEIEQDLAWTRAEWLSGAYAWIDGRLAEVGLERTGSPEQVHAYPWATVLRVPTTAADVFFKAMVPQLAHEAPAIAVLARLRPDLVTEVIVADPQRGWMLMRDAGAPVRTVADERIEDWGRLLADYARLQLAAADTVDELLAAGVPDRRLEKLPAQLAAVLADDDAVWAGREQGLTDEERAAIRDSTLPRFAALCAEAAALPVPETIQHDDLHGGQVFLRAGHWRILDWGDACVTHPFASLLIPLRSLLGTVSPLCHVFPGRCATLVTTVPA